MSKTRTAVKRPKHRGPLRPGRTAAKEERAPFTAPDRDFKPEAIGARIKALREERGLSLVELGARSGLAAPQIQRWEAGIRIPKVDHVVKLARGLARHVAELLDNAPVASNPPERDLLLKFRKLWPDQSKTLFATLNSLAEEADRRVKTAPQIGAPPPGPRKSEAAD